MSRIRSIFAPAPVAVFAVLLGAVISSCRPAADPEPLGPEIRIQLRTQPADARVGVPIGTPPVLELIDRDDELITQSGMTVRATVVSGQGQIGTGAEASVVGGVATFSNLVLVGPADGNVGLAFQLFQDGVANTSVGVVANTFKLITGPVTSMAAQPPTTIAGAPGQAVTPPPSVILKDVSGNVVSGATVTFSITAGEGRLTGASEVTTNAQGVAAVSGWVLGLPGLNQLKATTPTPTTPATPIGEVTFSAGVTTAAGMLRIRLTNTGGGTAKIRVLKTSAAGAIHDVVYDVHDSLTVTGLPFGTYQVSGDSLKVGNRIWVADAIVPGLNVAATSGPSIAINYREQGRFEITVHGLPTPAQTGVVDFLATAGEIAATFPVTVLNDAVTRSLGPLGTYDVVPRVVVVAGQQYAAVPVRQSVVLTNATVPKFTLNYSATTGTLTVTFAGTMPATGAPQIDVTGPGGFHETVFMSVTRTFTGLAPGTYTIVASQVSVDGTLYKPVPVTTVVTVTAGNITPVIITYDP